MSDIQKIKAIYGELCGYLSQAPRAEYIYNQPNIWNLYNNAIDELNLITSVDFSRFKVKIEESGADKWISVDAYRISLNGLILRLRSEYLPGEPQPFSGTPNAIITQQQSQNQSMHIQMLLEVQSKLDEKLSQYKEGSKEHNFLDTVKKSLSSVNNVIDLIKLISHIGTDIGLTAAQIFSLFS